MPKSFSASRTPIKRAVQMEVYSKVDKQKTPMIFSTAGANPNVFAAQLKKAGFKKIFLFENSKSELRWILFKGPKGFTLIPRDINELNVMPMVYYDFDYCESMRDHWQELRKYKNFAHCVTVTSRSFGGITKALRLYLRGQMDKMPVDFDWKTFGMYKPNNVKKSGWTRIGTGEYAYYTLNISSMNNKYILYSYKEPKPNQSDGKSGQPMLVIQKLL